MLNSSINSVNCSAVVSSWVVLKPECPFVGSEEFSTVQQMDYLSLSLFFLNVGNPGRLDITSERFADWQSLGAAINIHAMPMSQHHQLETKERLRSESEMQCVYYLE